MPSQPHSPALISLLLLLSISTATSFAETTARGSHKAASQKLTHFLVYWHDIVSGGHPTAVQIVTPSPCNSSSSSSFFGTVAMIDDALTEAPEPSSKLVGRAQGLYALASQEEVGLFMAMNFAFIEGKYNGSSITILGRNAISDKVREMPVVVGSGLFWFARGYVEARTQSFDPTTRDATVEYNCYVLGY